MSAPSSLINIPMPNKVDSMRSIEWHIDSPNSRGAPSHGPSHAEPESKHESSKHVENPTAAQSYQEIVQLAQKIADAVTAVQTYNYSPGLSHIVLHSGFKSEFKTVCELQEVAQLARNLSDVAEKAIAVVQHGEVAQSVSPRSSKSEEYRTLESEAHEKECPVCMDPVEFSQRFVGGECRHMLCNSCVRTYLRTLAVETKKFPIPCPTCSEPMNHQKCLGMLLGDEEAFNALHTLVLEKVHMNDIRYCANAACALPFDWEPDPSKRGAREEYLVFCPLCEKETCVQCKVEWHTGKSCQQYRSEQEADDELLKLARQQKWKSCPRCGNMIERRLGDCNFVRCRCGCGFCHKCGVAYRDSKIRSNNNHGTPGCTCGLFGADYYMERMPGRVRMGAVVVVGADYIRWRIDVERQRAEGRRAEIRRVRRQRPEVEREGNRMDGGQMAQPAGLEHVAWARGRAMRIGHGAEIEDGENDVRFKPMPQARPFAQAGAARMNAPAEERERANAGDMGGRADRGGENGRRDSRSRDDGARVVAEGEDERDHEDGEMKRGVGGWIRKRRFTRAGERVEAGTGKKLWRALRRTMSTLEG